VGNGVLEVYELSAKGVLVAGNDAHIGLAEGPANDFGGAAVVREGDGGPVFGSGCGSGRGRRGLAWGLVGGSVGRRQWRRGWRVAGGGSCSV
jgi:hypothetical protein